MRDSFSSTIGDRPVSCQGLDQVAPVPAALAARHHCRASAIGHGADRRVDVLRKRDRAHGQPGHRAAGAAACGGRAALAGGCAVATARSGADRCRTKTRGHAPVDRPHRRASVRRPPIRQGRWSGVFRSLHGRAGCTATAERCVCLHRRPAPQSDGRQARAGGHRGVRTDLAVLLRIGAVSALAAAVVEPTDVVGGGMATAGAQFFVEPARGVRYLVLAGVSAGRPDRADLVLHLVSRWHDGLARHRACDTGRQRR